MASVLVFFSSLFVCLFHLVRSECVANGTSCNKWECEYNLLLKLTKLEVKISQQDEKIAEQNGKIAEQNGKITEQNGKIAEQNGKIAEQNEKHLQQELMIETLTRNLEESRRSYEQDSSDGSTYVRWGRTSCPNNSTVVYNGYAAGSHFTHTGGAANAVCLTDKPVSGLVKVSGGSASYIYGAEYQTRHYNTWGNLLDNDVPCVVCRVTRSHVLMVPGSNICPNNYSPEYSGYLMAGHHTHKAAGEYLCMDGEPEKINGGLTSQDGFVLYIVQAQCGSLQCPPYENGREVTCVVCSYFTEYQSRSVQPYV